MGRLASTSQFIMTFPRFTHHPAWAGLLLSVVFLVACGCTKDPLPAYGEVAILLSTDMSVPDAFDTLVLGRDGGKRWVFTAGATPGLKDSECGDLSNPDQSGLVFPSTVVLHSNRDEPAALNFTLEACKGNVRVFERSFTVQMPAPGEQRMLRAPILWLCTDWTERCFGCDQVLGSPEQRCFHQHIARLQASEACETSACTDDSDKFYKTVDFRPSEVELYAQTSPHRNDCFDVRVTFDPSHSSAASVPTDWQTHPNDPGRKFCQARIDGDGTTNPKLNLALVLPSGDLGVCDASRCLVALEAFTPIGWARELPGTHEPVSPGVIVLPDAVCHLLDSGQILEVLASVDAPQKGYTTPFCSMTNETALPPDKVSADGKRYTLNDPRRWSSQDNSPPTLRTEVGTLDGLFSKIAVSGAGAGRFTNKQYAFAETRLLTGPVFTFSSWVSLTETRAGTDVSATDPMPILSDIDQTCSMGARLQLRSNAEQSEVVLELGIPTGLVPGSTEQCQLAWTCADFASKSLVGGFFTPWNQGVWRHVAVAHSGTPKIYLDGTAATPKACLEPFTFAAHDDSRFYLGSSRAELTSARTSQPILIDELAVNFSAIGELEILRQFLAPATVPGPSGLRWGAWGGQGSHASVTAGSPLLVSVNDLSNGSAGTYANLAAPLALNDADEASRIRDLSDFDEAVIVADLPPNKPFQFSLLSDHDTRQCTWQLFSKPSPTNLRYSDAVVVDLRRPSWCIDPNCAFDLRSVEYARLGSDWKNAEGSLEYSVRSLTFRKRTQADPSLDRTAAIGGMWGPHGWCWRSVSYAPQWDAAPVAAAEGGGVYFPAPVATPFSSDYAPEKQLPEVATDPSTNLGLGARDVMTCASMQLDVDWDPASPATSWNGSSEPEFAFKDERGHTAYFKLSRPQGLDTVLLMGGKPGIWPTPSEQEYEREYEQIRRSVTQISIRSDQAIAVNGLRCCDSTGTCQDLR